MNSIGTREGAISYNNTHRNVAPGLYNQKRLHEKPIPEVHDIDDTDNEPPSFEEIIIPYNAANDSNDGGGVEAANPLNISMNNTAVDEMPNMSVGDLDGAYGGENSSVIAIGTNKTTHGGGNSIGPNIRNTRSIQDDMATAPVNTDAAAGDLVGNNEPNACHGVAEAKPDTAAIFPIYELRANSNEILDELEEKCVETLTFEGEEMEITYAPSKGFGKPLNTTIDGRVKLEEPDPVSGMLPFISTVC